MIENNDIRTDIPADILDDWQEIVNLSASILRVPAALIMRYTAPCITVFVSSDSVGNPYHPGEKETLHGSGLYCETVIKTQKKLLVPDALADENWKNNPDVKLNMISYLGFPIRLPNKEPFGTLCVLDNKPNNYSDSAEKLMMKLSGLIESHLELIYMNHALGDNNKRLADYLTELQALRGLVPICSNCKSIRDNQENWHPIETVLLRHPQATFTHGICPKCLKKLYPDFADNS